MTEGFKVIVFSLKSTSEQSVETIQQKESLYLECPIRVDETAHIIEDHNYVKLTKTTILKDHV